MYILHVPFNLSSLKYHNYFLKKESTYIADDYVSFHFWPSIMPFIGMSKFLNACTRSLAFYIKIFT